MAEKNHWNVNVKDVNVVRLNVTKRGFKKLVSLLKKDQANILKVEIEEKEGKFTEVY